MRLFLSADLVGSTEFKARFDETRQTNEPHPVWVQRLEHFYEVFPRIVYEQYGQTITLNSLSTLGRGPQVWKTLGDEILFCCRILDLRHLSASLTAFLKALAVYGDLLERDETGKYLDLKATGWAAAFPAPNVTVHRVGISLGREGRPELTDESFEAAADKNPGEYDFLGKTMDAGFRCARNAAPDQFAVSIELAWLLANGVQRGLLKLRLRYHGRQVLKGVIGGRPYPVITVDSERDLHKRQLRTLEQNVSHKRDVDAEHLVTFLKAFMDHENVDTPSGLCVSDDAGETLPRSYGNFVAAWRVAATEQVRRTRSETAAESDSADDLADAADVMDAASEEMLVRARTARSLPPTPATSLERPPTRES